LKQFIKGASEETFAKILFSFCIPLNVKRGNVNVSSFVRGLI
jgi:hypothetical protein